MFSGSSTDCDADLSLNILLCFHCFKLHSVLLHLSFSSLTLFYLFFDLHCGFVSVPHPNQCQSTDVTHFVIRLGGFLLSTSMCVSMYGTKQRSTSAWPVPATADGTTSEIPCDEQSTPLFSDDHYGTWLQVMQHGDWT